MESGEVLVGERVGSLGIVDGFLREGGCRGGPLPVGRRRRPIRGNAGVVRGPWTFAVSWRAALSKSGSRWTGEPQLIFLLCGAVLG